MPKISIIVPIYNVEKYLPVCLDSIISQTFADFELICVNDGSSDGCGQILAEYENKDIFSRHLRCRFDSGPTPPWVHSHQQTHKKIKPQTGLYFFMVRAALRLSDSYIRRFKRKIAKNMLI